MKQILQNLKNGETIIEDVPMPNVKPGHLLIQTNNTLISAGTERMLVDFGKANIIDKARQQPDKVKQVIQKVKTDGFMPTLNAVKNKLDQPLALGYCNVGTVVEVGQGVENFSVGDRVLSNGKHAGYVLVPKNLCAKVPESVTDEAAVFTVIGAIALQGIRLARPTLGEVFVVTGLGLIGLIAVQLLKANGCKVIGLDFDADKLKLAEAMGAIPVNLSADEDPIKVANAMTDHKGVDGVLITASTKSNEPVHQAATMCRQRGRIVLVGVTGLELSRADFYEKELSFQVSCSYGPGRYDIEYEDKGHDYPYGLVRWTEQRNFSAVLGLLEDGMLDVSSLISHRFDVDDAEKAYHIISDENPLGIIINYPDDAIPLSEKRKIVLKNNSGAENDINIGFIGAGNYASQVLIPAFAKTNAALTEIASQTGVSAVHVAKKYNVSQVSTDSTKLIASNDNNVVVITTRHDNHAQFVCDALKAGKHLFVEKPLTINKEQLQQVVSVYEALSNRPMVMVGFNRRFSPLTQQIKQLLSNMHEPACFIMTVNAGDIPADHWTQDLEVGGGRIIGEACHFIDLVRFLADSSIHSIQSTRLGNADTGGIMHDKVTISIGFENGAMGTVHYLANGNKAFPKERLEVFCGGGILQLDNFRKLKGYGWPGFRSMNLRTQDKGNVACVAEFVKAIKTGAPSPISFDELVEVTEATFTVMEQIR